MYFSTYNYANSAWTPRDIFVRTMLEGLAQEMFGHFGEQQCDKSDPPIIIAFGNKALSILKAIIVQNRYLCSLHQSYAHQVESYCFADQSVFGRPPLFM